MKRHFFMTLLCISSVLLLSDMNSIFCTTITPGGSAKYTLAGLENPPAQNVVRISITTGDTEIRDGFPYFWIYLKGEKKNGQAYEMWALVDRWPGNPRNMKSVSTARYIFREGDGDAKEYIHASTGEAFLPEVRKWDILFPANTGDDNLPFTRRVHYMGHDFTRTAQAQDTKVTIPATVKIALQPDISVGTGRNFRETEGFRLSGNREYTYVDYTREDMDELMSVGRNHFWVSEEQYEWIKDEPVFSVHPKAGDHFPELLYRSNMLGGHAYYDEPGHRGRSEMTADMTPSEMAQKVVEFTKESERTDAMHNSFSRRADINLGDLDLRHPIPEWETIVSSVWYGMRGGATGTIHEGRYILRRHIPMYNLMYGCSIPSYPENILRIYYACMRGAARHFGADWGVAIYGRMEPRMAPQALTLAYDMGARYFWFWTSDHYSHMPYPEQIDLSRHLKGHTERNKNRDMDALLHAAKVAIALPDGYTFEYSGLMFNQRTHHPERVNEYGVTYRSVLHNAAVEMERLLRLGIDFDIVIDADGFDGRGYEEVIYAKPNAELSIVKNGVEVIRSDPRTPPRPSLQAKPEIMASVIRNGRSVELSATPSGGCPPLGFDSGIDNETMRQKRVLVIWEHYSPAGGYRLLRGAEHSLDLKEAGTHRFRAITTDAYASIADKWESITID